ncbi:MAG: delta-aminolevulinic acid dehydratase [Pseudomonadota bacterium]
MGALGSLALIFGLFLPRTASAECACLWQGAFADVQHDADVVVAGSVLRSKGNSLDLAVERNLRGDAYFDEIRIWMHAKDYCRPPVEDFPPGSRWVMALTRIREVPEDGFDPSTPNQSYGRVGDYFLPNCGGYWLTFSGEAVTGNLIDAPRWARDPDMQPVLISLIESFLEGRADRDALRAATQEDPELEDLMLDTRAFLRGDTQLDDRQ